MRIRALRLPGLLVVLLLSSTASAVGHAGQPIPPGRTAANNATRQAEKVEPPVAAQPGNGQFTLRHNHLRGICKLYRRKERVTRSRVRRNG